MSENSLMIPNKAEIPAYILNPELARQANEDAAAGIGTGYPARIKLMGTKFAMVDGNGEEKPYPPSKMIIGPDENQYMPVVVLRAKKALQKAWYLKKYDPNADAFQAPDCFSNDGERPDPSSSSKQCETCAACPHNAFGSGMDQNGNASKGKACSDSKILAVFVPNFGVHSFKLPPASLKNFGLYVKQLSANGIPLGTVKTLVGFDLAQTYPVLVFKFGGFLKQDHMAQLEEMALSPEVDDIVKGISSTPSAPALPAPPKQVSKPAAPPPVEDDGMGLGLDDGKVAAEAEAKAKADAAAKKTKAAAAKKAKADAEAKAAAEAALAAQAAETPAVYDPSEVSDQELIDELGLDDL